VAKRGKRNRISWSQARRRMYIRYVYLFCLWSVSFYCLCRARALVGKPVDFLHHPTQHSSFAELALLRRRRQRGFTRSRKTLGRPWLRNLDGAGAASICRPRPCRGCLGIVLGWWYQGTTPWLGLTPRQLLLPSTTAWVMPNALSVAAFASLPCVFSCPGRRGGWRNDAARLNCFVLCRVKCKKQRAWASMGNVGGVA
jgi:hypothetical protein